MSNIFGSVLNYQNLINLLQQKSTECHSQAHKLLSTWNLLVKIADDDLKQMISVGLGEPSFDAENVSPEVADIFTQVRDWQYAIKNISDNYFGAGSVSDGSFHCAKRANPLIQ